MTTSIHINGVNITGRNITINNQRVTVNGVDVTPDAKNISIEVHGHIETLHADAVGPVTIHGGAGSVHTLSGDVYCDEIAGSVQTMSGDVNCAGAVGGNIKTMSGDITTRSR